jgi:hypothetical protein
MINIKGVISVFLPFPFCCGFRAMRILSYLFLVASFPRWNSCNAATSPLTFQAEGASFRAPVTTAPGFSARVLFSNLATRRGITLDADENILVVERGFGVTAFRPVDGGWQRTVVVANPNFTQGIQIDDGLLYVSTASEVLVYSYDAVYQSVNSTVPRTVVTGLPPDGGVLHSVAV